MKGRPDKIRILYIYIYLMLISVIQGVTRLVQKIKNIIGKELWDTMYFYLKCQFIPNSIIFIILHVIWLQQFVNC